ncbi:hypothetical protein Ddc_13182 [Ditylenchus destructor]|nr:hypothetical protein Ddc_13182 [Ditylenchus destructor]
MSCSKSVPPFTFDTLYYLNRDQLERFSIVCRPLKNFIERYFHSKPYRVFDLLYIRGGSYALVHNDVRFHPNRDDYSVQQFLAGQICNRNDYEYHSFTEMHPYLGPTVRITETNIDIAGNVTYNPEQIEQMESITYLWRDHKIDIWNSENCACLDSEDFQLILNSPTILKCKTLHLSNAYFSFKDYKVLYTVKILEIRYWGKNETDLWHIRNNFPRYLEYWQQFLEQTGVKPVVVFLFLRDKDIEHLLVRLSKAFSSAVSPNAFKIVFVNVCLRLTEFRETNKSSGEILELKKGFPTEIQKKLHCHRSSGLRPLERWLCQCQLAAFGRSNAGFVSANSRPSAARTLALSVPTRGLRPLDLHP